MTYNERYVLSAYNFGGGNVFMVFERIVQIKLFWGTWYFNFSIARYPEKEIAIQEANKYCNFIKVKLHVRFGQDDYKKLFND